MKHATILGVKIDDVNLEAAVEVVGDWLKQAQKRYIVTPNPEFLMAAQSDSEFRKVLNSADLAIPDGVGLRLSGDIVSTTSGVDLMEELIKRSPDWTVSVGFLGGKNGVAKRTSECLKKKYPKIKISFADSGGIIDSDGNFADRASNFKIPKTDILFVGFGHAKQEKWIAKNLAKSSVKIMMGVGGSFDYLSGEVSRAPKILRSLGLEWLFRLILQPWRIKRQLSLLKFVWLVLKARFTK